MKKNSRAPRSVHPASIPLGCKSYLHDWLRRMGIHHSKTDIHLRANADGWRSLTATILAEIVCAAAQNEDLILSREAKEWLKSPAAETMFEECNLNYTALIPWLAAGCPLPEALLPSSISSSPKEDLYGIAFGRLTLDRYDPIYPDEIFDILAAACIQMKNDRIPST